MRKKKSRSSLLFLIVFVATIAGVIYIYNSETFERKMPIVTADNEIYWNLKEPIKVDVKSTMVSKACQTKMDDESYETLLDSGIKREKSFSHDGSVALESKYLSHYKRGVYNDTRAILIYPKLKELSKKKLYKYGPAQPRTHVYYDKAYEGKLFYVYDYLDKSCYEGIFPSMKIPPFSSLKKLKEE